MSSSSKRGCSGPGMTFASGSASRRETTPLLYRVDRNERDSATDAVAAAHTSTLKTFMIDVVRKISYCGGIAACLRRSVCCLLCQKKSRQVALSGNEGKQ